MRPSLGVASEPGAPRFTAFLFVRVFNLLNVRSRNGSVFALYSPDQPGPVQASAECCCSGYWMNLPPLLRLCATVGLRGWGSGVAVPVASSALWVEEPGRTQQ